MTILAISIILITSSLTARFTTLTPFKAKDPKAIAAAKDQASKDGLKNPRLFLVGTMSGELPIQIPITITIDLDKGNATAWAYCFADTNLDSMKTYAVVQVPFLGYFPFAVPSSLILAQLLFVPTKSLDSSNWKSIENLKDSLNKNAMFIQFKKDRPDWTINLVGLGMNTTDSMLAMDKPYWMMVFNSGGGMLTCFVQAETGETNCIGYWGVEDNADMTKFEIYPNPASEQALLILPPSIQSLNSKLELFDSFGKLIRNLYAPVSGETDKVMINTSGLSNGVYLLQYSSKDKTYSTKLLIHR